jgi:hypothetical protein
MKVEGLTLYITNKMLDDHFCRWGPRFLCQHHLKAFDQGLQEGEAVKVYSYGDGG